MIYFQNQQISVDKDIVILQKTCSDYKEHLEETKEQDRTLLTNQKIDIMDQLLKSLELGSIEDKKANFYKIFSNPYSPSKDALKFKGSKQLTCRDILKESRDSRARFVLKVIATIFSLFIALAFGIWNVKGEEVGDELAKKEPISPKQKK